MFKSHRKGAIGAVIAILLLAAGAYAYWTQGGSGTGTASTATTTSNVTVNQTSSLTGMYPGDSAQTLSGNFNNPNSGSVYVTQVVASIASVTKAGGAPAGTCDATDYTLANATMAVGAQVAPGNNQGAWTGATIKFNNKVTNQDACRGATVNLSYTAS